MPKASEVAQELRKLADALDKEPDTSISNVYCGISLKSKESFLSVARVLPRPLWKDLSATEYVLDNRQHKPDGSLDFGAAWPAIHIRAQVDRSLVCRLVKPAIPAKYECDPLLSQEEEASLTEG